MEVDGGGGGGWLSSSLTSSSSSSSFGSWCSCCIAGCSREPTYAHSLVPKGQHTLAGHWLPSVLFSPSLQQRSRVSVFPMPEVLRCST